MRLVIQTLMQARAEVLERIKVLDRQVLAAAKRNPTARLFMTAPGVGAITALSVASAFDDAARFRRSSSAGARGGSPRHSESSPRKYRRARLGAACGLRPSNPDRQDA